ncbi:Holliday junction resolvase RuvX [Verticiella sediminum]|uniref:Putative pre-16S rRNA nuclease n=1 Tax=Verticiella sediminum TaxID=1247510 RepID=A0A556A7L9_9BURK|nr:Holliday junction resolvase RuvX [Verticiella sediminum]TSH88859.1 Holliday junction resolvase RuvX [Verticiella sediminum]
MPEHALLGFDFGTRRIGVALGNTLTRTARPLEAIASEPVAARFARIAALLDEWQPGAAVVGLALDAEGGEQAATGRCRRFADQLRGRFRLQVHLQDERHSSLEAQRVLGRGGEDDAMAAAIILQRYLDAL